MTGTNTFTTIGEIVAADFRTAAVFQRHQIDFCCQGARTIERGYREAGVDATDVLREIDEVRSQGSNGAPWFNTWGLPTLIDYIVANHHEYGRQQLALIVPHSRRIADAHGNRHPELRRVAELVVEIADEMTAHMVKEEHVLFPYIAQLAEAAAARRPAPRAPFGSVDSPIRVMEAEHESAGRAMLEIRELTDGFVPPPDACTTYRVCLQELDAFEQDLHAHVHLENNILFPKASALEAAGR